MSELSEPCSCGNHNDNTTFEPLENTEECEVSAESSLQNLLDHVSIKRDLSHDASDQAYNDIIKEEQDNMTDESIDDEDEHNSNDWKPRLTKKELKKQERSQRKQKRKEIKKHIEKEKEAEVEIEQTIEKNSDELKKMDTEEVKLNKEGNSAQSQIFIQKNNKKLKPHQRTKIPLPSVTLEHEYKDQEFGKYSEYLERVDDVTIRIKKGFVPNMLTEGIVYANHELSSLLLVELHSSGGGSGGGGFLSSMIQVANVASLPGIVGKSYAMPDIHSGYGFCIGNVAAVDMSDPNAVVSPGGVGFDINCGVRLIRTNLMRSQIKEKTLQRLADTLYRDIPVGVGSHSKFSINSSNLEQILNHGMKYLLQENLIWPEDIEHVEEHGSMPGADAKYVSTRAKQRGLPQCGSLGSGNHYAEVQVVDEIFSEREAQVMGLQKGQIVIMLHSGSRGLGHEVCSNYVQNIHKINATKGIKLNDKQLSPVLIHSDEGRAYLAAMSAAANYAFVNRSLMTTLVRNVFENVFNCSARDLDMHVVYDVSHNIAKVEKHTINGEIKEVLVHRKGATRAFPPHHPDISKDYQEIGQPVLIGGSMGTCSYVLTGLPGSMTHSFGSTCHGAGRALSRSGAMRELNSRQVLQELSDKGIAIRIAQKGTAAEEAPGAYKDVTQVVDTCEAAGISKKVAKMIPIAVIKG